MEKIILQKREGSSYPMNRKKLKKENFVLMVLVIILALVPLLVIKDSEFEGADGKAEEAIVEVQADYEPWFQPALQPPGGETESLLFALQAALGTGVIFYSIGYLKGREKGAKSNVKANPVAPTAAP